jgi:hypothetical protein
MKPIYSLNALLVGEHRPWRIERILEVLAAPLHLFAFIAAATLLAAATVNDRSASVRAA